jgi:hypothetical protein
MEGMYFLKSFSSDVLGHIFCDFFIKLYMYEEELTFGLLAL